MGEREPWPRRVLALLKGRQLPLHIEPKHRRFTGPRGQPARRCATCGDWVIESEWAHMDEPERCALCMQMDGDPEPPRAA